MRVGCVAINGDPFLASFWRMSVRGTSISEFDYRTPGLGRQTDAASHRQEKRWRESCWPRNLSPAANELLIEKSDETRTNWLLAKVILSLSKETLAGLAPENLLEITLSASKGDFSLGTQCPISNCVLYKVLGHPRITSTRPSTRAPLLGRWSPDRL